MSARDDQRDPGVRWAWWVGAATQCVLLVLVLAALLCAWFLGAETADFRYEGF